MAIDKHALEHLGMQVTIMLGTATPDGRPNLAPIALYWFEGDDRLLVGDIYLRRSVVDVKANPQVQICFWDEASHAAFKYNGQASYVTSGPDYDTCAKHLIEAGEDPKALKGAIVIELDEE